MSGRRPQSATAEEISQEIREWLEWRRTVAASGEDYRKANAAIADLRAKQAEL